MRLPRGHLAVLVLLLLLGTVRGVWWVGLMHVWRGDEQQHFGYVHQLATGGGLPIVGEDLLPADVMAVMKESPTVGHLSRDVTADPADPRWYSWAQQYEGGQPPLYYALLALPYRLVADESVLVRLYVLRVLTLLLALTTVPLVWLLARVALPDHSWTWLAAPALLVTWQGWNAFFAGVTNDALVAPLGLAALIAVAWAWQRGPSLWPAATAGLASGLGFLAKPSIVVLALPLAIGGVAMLVRHRAGPARAAAWVGTAVACAAAPVLPWLLWQRAAYGDDPAVDRFNRIIGPGMGQYPWSGETFVMYLRDVTRGLYNHAELQPGWTRYSLALTAVAALAAVVGVGVALARGQRTTAALLAWLAAALPLGFATYVVVVQRLLDDYGTIVGRYFTVALAATAVVIAGAAALALGRRGGIAAVAVIAALGLSLEIEVDRTYVEAIYLRGLPEAGSAPVLVQERGGTFVPAADFTVDAPCEASTIGLAYDGPSPATLTLDSDGVTTEAPRIAADWVQDALWMSYYRIAPAARTFTVRTAAPEGSRIAAALEDLSPALGGVQGAGDPVARVYCPAEDPRAVRFAQTHAPQHPDLPYRLVAGWPVGWAILGWAAAVLACTWLVRERSRS